MHHADYELLLARQQHHRITQTLGSYTLQPMLCRTPRLQTLLQAKETIKVDVYLNAADAETKAMERATIRQRAMEHTAQLKALYETRRGKTLV